MSEPLIILIIPAFIAGILTFIAPCTLPLVPAYLAFITGIPIKDLQDQSKVKTARKKIITNAVIFVIGFSIVFILLGSLFGLGGAALVKYKILLSKIGGVFIIIFGLFIINIFHFPAFGFIKKTQIFIERLKFLQPGKPFTSLIFGMAFAFGWTPCIGPILGIALTLAASSATVGSGAFLLLIFSIGLAIPFIIIALAISSASAYIAKYGKVLNIISIIGGILLIFLGILLLKGNFSIWVSYVYQLFDFINYDKLLDYL